MFASFFGKCYMWKATKNASAETVSFARRQGGPFNVHHPAALCHAPGGTALFACHDFSLDVRLTVSLVLSCRRVSTSMLPPTHGWQALR